MTPAVVTCSVCAEPLELDSAVGLNGKFSHVLCFSAALKTALAPLKGAIRELSLPEALGPISAYEMGQITAAALKRQARRRK